MAILHDLLAKLASPVIGGGDLPDPPPNEPMVLLHSWLDDATKSGKYADANAMTLATCTPDGRPSARIVLCKAIEPAPAQDAQSSPRADGVTMARPTTEGPPALVFFTNYQSRKGEELLANPRVACVFHWPHAQRQVRVEGDVVKTSEPESDEYFKTRHPLSRIGAWASKQSRPLQSRGDLVTEATRYATRMAAGSVGGAVEGAAKSIARALGMTSSTHSESHGDPSSLSMPSDLSTRPPWWGGYRILIRSVELWSAREGRLHDRFRWELTSTLGVTPAAWRVERLSP